MQPFNHHPSGLISREWVSGTVSKTEISAKLMYFEKTCRGYSTAEWIVLPWEIAALLAWFCSQVTASGSFWRISVTGACISLASNFTDSARMTANLPDAAWKPLPYRPIFQMPLPLQFKGWSQPVFLKICHHWHLIFSAGIITYQLPCSDNLRGGVRDKGELNFDCRN